MSSVPPLLTPSLPQAQHAAPVAAEVVVVQAAAQVAAKLAAAKALEALVVSQQRDGAALIRTELGMLQVKLPVAVADGAKLALQVLPPGADGAAAALRLTAVDGRALTAAMMAGRAASAVAAMPAAVEVLPSGGGQPTLLATMVKPTIPPPAGSQGVPAGTVFPVRLVSAALSGDLPPSGTGPAMSPSPPAAGSAPMPGATGLNAAPSSAPASPAGSPSSLSAPAAMPVGGASASSAALLSATAASLSGESASAVSTLPPAASAPPSVAALMAQEGTAEGPGSPPGPSALPTTSQPALPTTSPAAPPITLPATLSGTVAPNTLAGQPLVQTDLGLITLQGGGGLPAGAQVELQVTGPATRPDAAAASSSAAASSTTAPWSGLAAGLGSLSEADPAVAARFAAGLPELGPRLAHGMAAFVAAAQANVLRPAYGDRMAQALEKAGRGEAGKRLLQELDGAAPQIGRDAGGEWRVMSVPVLNGAIVEPVRLYLRRSAQDEGEGGQAGGGEQGQRFVVDVSLSALGRMQIDGLLRRSLKRFNVLVRTAHPLPEAMRRDISRIFADGCSAAGVSGEAGFQVTQRFVEPVVDALSRVPGVLA